MKTYARKITLLSLIAVFLVIYILQLSFTGKAKSETFKLSQEIDSILLESSQSGKILLSKEGENWVVGNQKYAADSNVVQTLIDELKEIKTVGVAANQLGDDASRYGLGEGERITVTASAGEKDLRILVVGKDASTGGQSYIMVDGKPAIYLSSSALNGQFSRTVEDFRSKKVYSLNSSDVTSVGVKTQGQEFVLGKQFALAADTNDSASEVTTSGTTWKFLKNTTDFTDADLDAEKITTWANSLSYLNVSEWKEDNYSLSRDTLVCTVTITQGNSDTIISLYKTPETVMKAVQNQDGSQEEVPAPVYVMASNQNQYKFSASDFSVAKYNKTILDFIKTQETAE